MAAFRFFLQNFRLLSNNIITIKMKKKQLIDKLSEETGMSKTRTEEMLSNTKNALTDTLSDGKGVSIPDLGTFSTKTNEVRKIYNPHHEAYMMVPPKRVVEFSPSSGLKEKLKFVGRDNE